MVQEAAKLQTKLQACDIHSHWLRPGHHPDCSGKRPDHQEELEDELQEVVTASDVPAAIRTIRCHPANITPATKPPLNMNVTKLRVPIVLFTGASTNCDEQELQIDQDIQT